MIATPFSWKILLFEGIVFFLLGMIALAYPFIIALSLEVILGGLLTAAGIVQGFHALGALKDSRSGALLVAAAFSLIAGILLLSYPLSGVLTLTLLLTAYFFVDGISRIVSSFQFRPTKGWFWLLISGLVSVLLAILIISGLPTTAVWIIGIYVGIYMLFLGVSFITLSFYLKKEAL
jgi:uncharacterized membrane protein HdeD (DUF308 family)